MAYSQWDKFLALRYSGLGEIGMFVSRDDPGRKLVLVTRNPVENSSFEICYPTRPFLTFSDAVTRRLGCFADARARAQRHGPPSEFQVFSPRDQCGRCRLLRDLEPNEHRPCGRLIAFSSFKPVRQQPCVTYYAKHGPTCSPVDEPRSRPQITAMLGSRHESGPCQIHWATGVNCRSRNLFR